MDLGASLRDHLACSVPSVAGWLLVTGCQLVDLCGRPVVLLSTGSVEGGCWSRVLLMSDRLWWEGEKREGELRKTRPSLFGAETATKILFQCSSVWTAWLLCPHSKTNMYVAVEQGTWDTFRLYFLWRFFILEALAEYAEDMVRD